MNMFKLTYHQILIKDSYSVPVILQRKTKTFQFMKKYLLESSDFSNILYKSEI